MISLPYKMKNGFIKKKPVLMCIDSDFDDRAHAFSKPNYGHLLYMTSLELFELFFTDIIDLLVEKTKKYFLFKNCHNQNIISDKMRCFIKTLILKGYNHVPSKLLY